MLIAGIYVRISKADKKKICVSNSIENQILIISRYIDRSDIDITDRIVYKDDGYSGRNGRRPAFRRLLADMFLGRIHLVIVKDFSRLSRDHLFVSQIRQIMCPEFGIRLISVSDRYDSSIINHSELSLEFRSLFDEYYCYDISKKVRSSLEARKEEGKYAVARLPYGYKYDKLQKPAVKEDEASVVRCIYDLAADGYNNRYITDYINQKYNKNWEITSIWRILNNPMYAGYHIWHKYENEFRDYGTKKLLPRSQWKYSKDDSIAIIDEDTLKRIYEIRKIKSDKNIQKGCRHIFHGITKCGGCGRALVRGRRQKDVLVCNHCSRREERRIVIKELYDIVIFIIRKKCGKELDIDEKNRELFIQTVVKKIYVHTDGTIDIYWNFTED